MIKGDLKTALEKVSKSFPNHPKMNSMALHLGQQDTQMLKARAGVYTQVFLDPQHNFCLKV